MNVTDSKQIVQRIKSKLIHALGTTIGEATNDEIYKAAAECIREDIMTSWADSRRRERQVQVLITSFCRSSQIRIKSPHLPLK